MLKYNKRSFIYKKHFSQLKCLVSFFVLFASSNVFAADCQSDGVGSFMVGFTGVNQNCNFVPGTSGQIVLSPSNPYYILTRSSLNQQLSVGDTDIRIERLQDGWDGVGNQYAMGTNGASIALADFSVSVKAQYGVIIGTHSLVDITAKNVNIDANYIYTIGRNSSGGVASYAVLAGSTVNSGEKFGTGKYSTVTFDNLKINQTAVGGVINPVLNAGLRAIQGAPNNEGKGSSGRIIVNNQFDMTLKGWRLEGIYVSGAGEDASNNIISSQVILNNSNIKLTQLEDSFGLTQDNQSSAIKIGKARDIGTGKGEVYSKGILNIDSSEAIGDAIKLYDSQSIFKADYDSSISNILANKSVIAVGPDDWGVTSSQATRDNAVYLNNANFNTVSKTDSLIKVYDKQFNFMLNVKGKDSIFNSAEQGLLFEVGKDSIVKAKLDSGKYFGMTKYDTGSELNVDMSNNAVWYLKNAPSNTASVTMLSLASGATLDATGNVTPGNKSIAMHDGYKMNVADGDNLTYSSLSQNNSFTLKGDIKSDAGIINLSKSSLSQPAYFTQLKIDGTYVGANGALINLDTVLGDDSSQTDFLHITGSASGETGVKVTNRNGLGALTIADGIKLIKVDGDTNKSVFYLKGDYTFDGKQAVIGGAYVYMLYAGNKEGDFAGDWYLRSVYKKPKDTTDEPDKPDPTRPVEPEKPIYSPTVPMYELYPQILQQLNKLGTLEQRVGNRKWLSTEIDAQNALMHEVEGRGFWMKVEGSTGHINSRKSKTRSEYDFDIIKTQLGLDFIAAENQHGKLIGGVYFQYGHAKADIFSRYGYGDIKTDGYGLGGTLTWYGANNVYVDGVAQIMWYDSDIRSHWLNPKMLVKGNKGNGYALSIEAGKKIRLNEEWTMTPQAQLSYNSIDFDRFNDNYAGRISLVNGDALTGRLGVAFNREKAWKSEKGDLRRLKTYLIGNLYYDFLNGTKVSVTNVDFNNRADRFWGGLGAGVSYNWKDDAYSLYGEVDARTSFSNFASSYSFYGTIGFRAKF